MMYRDNTKGFTLIELMIVVVVLGIIVAIAYPAYQGMVQQARQSDAKSVLMETAQKLERCYTESNAYDDDGSGGDCVDLSSLSSEQGYYDVGGTITSNTFTLEATPAAGSPQADDDECAKFILAHTGEQTAEDSAGNDSPHCW